MAKSVEEYFDWNESYRPLLEKLRAAILRSELKEEMKWGIPTYTLYEKNILAIGAFKAYAGIWFFNGVFLIDKAKKLVNAQEGKTKGMRQWRFNSVDDVDEVLLASYIREAIINQKAGKELKAEKKSLEVPEELKEALASDSNLSEMFDQMNLTNKRDYSEYIASAKKPETKQRRLEKIIPMILNGAGLNDKYKP